MPEFSFITWVNDSALYEGLRASCSRLDAEWIAVGQDCKSLAEAYNSGTRRASGRFLAYAHQDIHILDTQFPDKIRGICDRHADIGFIGPIGAVTNNRKFVWSAEEWDFHKGWIVQGNSVLYRDSYNGFA